MVCSMRVSSCSFPRWLAAAAVLLALSACGGGSSPAPAPPAPPGPPATLTLSGSSAQALAGGKPVALTAAASANAGTLNWTLGAGNPGSLSASSGASVTYLPPAAVTANTPVTVTVSGTGVTKSFALTLYPDPGPAGLALIAGNVGGYGQIDEAGTAARFLPIHGFASDAQSNLFVAAFEPQDGGRTTIRKVTPAGVVSTIIDSTQGYVDGPAASARLSGPTSVAAGADGTVFVVDKNGIRTISTSGVVGTLTTAFNNFANQPEPGSLGYRDNSATRIVADGAGGLYVMERSRISKVSASGSVTEFAGKLDALYQLVDGQGSAARFWYLRGIAIDKAGNLFVIDGSAVRKITPGGLVSTLAGAPEQTVGGPLDGIGSAARFLAPSSLTVDARGDVLVLDDTSQTIVYPTPFAPTTIIIKALRRVTPAGEVSAGITGITQWGAVGIDASGRIVLAGDAYLIRQDASGSYVGEAGKRDDTVLDIDGPYYLARLAHPQYIAADSAGTLYVIEQGGRDVTGRLETGLFLRKIAIDGTVTTLSGRGTWWGKPGTGAVPLTNPSGITVDRLGNLYISEASVFSNLNIIVGGGTIVKITPDGVASVFAGKHNDTLQPSARVDGVGAAAVLLNPTLLGFDADGNLYADDGAIRKITPDRVVTTVSALPAGFGADADGNIYVRDGTTVTRVAANGVRTVVAGVPGQPGNKLGALPGSLYAQLQERGALVRTGPASFAVISGSAILELVLPH
jgi:hypothetical protein